MVFFILGYQTYNLVKLKYWSLLLVVILVHTVKAQSISTLKWKNRILILMDSEGNTHIRNEQLKAFDDLEEEIEDRDLVLFCYDGKYLLDQELRKTTYQLTSNIDAAFQGIILIGKDGGIKLKRPFTLEPKKVFETIDSMPMRKSEMRKSGNN